MHPGRVSRVLWLCLFDFGGRFPVGLLPSWGGICGVFGAKWNIPFPAPRTAEPEAPPVLHPALWREGKRESIVRESLSWGTHLGGGFPHRRQGTPAMGC